MKFQVSPAFYESIFDNMFDGLAYCQMIFDTQGQPVDWIYLRVNKNFEKLTGLKDAEGRGVIELIPGIKTSNPELFEIYGRVALTGAPDKFEVYLKPLLKWFFISVYCPKKKFFVAIFQNITEQKQRDKDIENAKIAARNVFDDLQAEEKKLAEAKAKDEALLESIGEGVIAVDQYGKTIIMNKVAENLLGFASREIIGKLFVQIVSLEDAGGNRIPDAERPVSLALSSGKSTTTTTTDRYFIHKSGTKFPAAIIATPVILDAKPVGAIVVFRDITKEKEIEKAKNEFLSLASHQLRTPLTGIQWTLERFSKKEKLTQDGKKYFNNVFSSIERLNELVKLLLSVSRIESGSFKTSPELIDLVEFIEKSLEEVRPICEKRKVSLIFSEHPEKLELKIDKSALAHILGNLFGNAVDYTKPGGKVDIFLETKDGCVVLKIKDNGIGIPLKDKPNIFGKFVRASNAHMLKPDGTGLGLYIVKEAVKLLNGKIWFESEENKGTTFYVELPISV